MDTDKLEPRLLELIEDEKRRATAQGLAAAAIDREETFEVTIAHQETVAAHEGAHEDEERDEALRDLEQEVGRRQEPVLARLRELAPDASIMTHTLVNAVTVQLTPVQMAQIAELDEVGLIRIEQLDEVALMRDSAPLVEAPLAWEELGYDGRGVRVAILDSGVDSNHPALLGKVVDEVSTTPQPVNVPGSHGTHVAGSVASNDPVHRGVAYQADLVNIKVLTSNGAGQPQWVISGLEQAVRRGARVANLSLGWSEPFHNWVCDDGDCILCQAADNATRLGVTVVVAAGNEGNVTANPPHLGKFNIRHPGAARRVITVGAVDKAKQLASFSSIGPGSARLSPATTVRLTKPEVAAPGVAITSPIPPNGFAGFSGTSMAAPHVAGIAALILQKNPDATPMMVKKVLQETCEPLPYTPNETGHGLVNAYGPLLRELPRKV